MAFVRTASLLGALTGILLALGFLFAGAAGVTLALIFAFFMNFFSYWYSDKIVLSIYRARPLNDKRIEGIVRRLAKEAGIPEPGVYVVPISVPNAFATGRNPEHAAVAVTQGLLDLLEEDEVEAVISHEIGHIKNRDTLTSTIAATIAGAISYLAYMAWWGLFTGERREGGSAFLIPLLFLAPLAATLVQLAISRGREFAADRTGALISKKPLALASALEKISSIARHSPIQGNAATSHLWIVNPFKHDALSKLFSTHPPVEERIRKLMEVAKNSEPK